MLRRHSRNARLFDLTPLPSEGVGCVTSVKKKDVLTMCLHPTSQRARDKHRSVSSGLGSRSLCSQPEARALALTIAGKRFKRLTNIHSAHYRKITQVIIRGEMSAHTLTAQKMLRAQRPFDLMIKYTGLTREQIEEVREKS